MLIGKVLELLQLSGRGTVVVLDLSFDQLPAEVRLSKMDSVEFHTPSGKVERSTVTGIEHADPWTPKRQFAFLVPSTLTEDVIPIDSEVWLVT